MPPMLPPTTPCKHTKNFPNFKHEKLTEVNELCQNCRYFKIDGYYQHLQLGYEMEHLRMRVEENEANPVQQQRYAYLMSENLQEKKRTLEREILVKLGTDNHWYIETGNPSYDQPAMERRIDAMGADMGTDTGAKKRKASKSPSESP